MSIKDTTSETQAFLNNVCLEDMQNPDTWKRLRTLVRIRTDNDLLPVRAKYNGKTNTIGLNHITNEKPLWYTLADCVTSKLLTGKTPIIDEARCGPFLWSNVFIGGYHYTPVTLLRPFFVSGVSPRGIL